MQCDSESSVPDWIIEYPRTQAVFDELRIDCSCGGRSLRFLCEQRGIDPDVVVAALHRAITIHESLDMKASTVSKKYFAKGTINGH